MATSVFTFSGITTVADNLLTATLDANFTPPSNISGKTCYVHCTAFNWDFAGSTLTFSSREAISFYHSWPQTLSGSCTKNGTTLRVPAALFHSNNAMFYSTGPILCYIPDGPQTVSFTVYREDGSPIASSMANNYFFAAFKIVPADSRQPPIGV